jgi:5-methylcytosine-specific restriction endonuclease McrA
VKKYDWIEKPRRAKNLRVVNAARRERCELCASKNGGMHIHHVRSRGAGGNDVPENLVCLCWRCHDEVHRGVIPREVFLAFIRQRNAFRGRLRAS